MTFTDACNIAYPLHSAINNHLREEEAAEHYREEISRYVDDYTCDTEGIAALRDKCESLNDDIDLLLFVIMSHPVDSRTIEHVKEFRLKFFRAAHDAARKKLDAEIKQAREEAAVLRWELKHCEV